MVNAYIYEALEAQRGELDESSLAFARRIFADGLDKYERRLVQHGFASHDRVLDAGCGFGQWSLSLARLNRTVNAIDSSAARVKVLDAAARRLDLRNLSARTGSVDRLPYPTGAFDAVFCYGVVFLTPWKTTLRELIRVLVPGGLLYLNANGFGWYSFLWHTNHNRSSGYEPRERVGKAFLNTFRYQHGLPIEEGMDIVVEPEELLAELCALGCTIVENAAEGHTGLTSYTGPKTEPFFVGEYRGETGVYEVIARAPGYALASTAE
jgi:SAM-dependent methyltransferase